MKRKILRNRARLKMKREGIQRPNRKIRSGKGDKAISFFSTHWREYSMGRVNRA